MEAGQLDVLNCGEGHLELKFEKDDPIETARAKRIIGDMLKRGYALFVQKGKALTRVKRFNEDEGVYIIADGPSVTVKSPEPASVGELTGQPIPPDLKRGRGRPKTKVPMHGTKAVAVGRSAGG